MMKKITSLLLLWVMVLPLWAQFHDPVSFSVSQKKLSDSEFEIVFTGKAEAVRKANEALLSSGAKRAILLNVSGPFHSPFLKEAGEKLGKVLEGISFKELERPYVTNVTAQYVTDIEDTKPLLEKQVYSSVRWQQSVEQMIADGVDMFVEIGPGKTLAGFIRKINKEVKVFHVSEWEDVEKIGENICYRGK